jgi:pyruvate/2-oxoglutarate dehydrogenase complex dihydrolipoamide dehydrogenase (E3) component
MGVTVVEHAGYARFVDAHTVEVADGSRFESATFVLCVGGTPRSLPVPGGELALTHSAAWAIEQPPGSMIVIGGGATGTQVASVFQAFGTKVELIQVNSRILPGGDEDVSAAVSDGFRQRGIIVRESVESIDAVQQADDAMRVTLTIDGVRSTSTADVVLAAIGWAANVDALGLSSIGVELDGRGFVAVDDYQRTTVPHVFAAGDVTGGVQLVPEANQAGYVAATNAVKGPVARRPSEHGPLGSFTDPEFASVGKTEPQARADHDVVVVSIGFDQTTRSIIDGHAEGFCKLIVDRKTHQVLGCHVVGDRAVDIAQVAYMAMQGRVDVVRLAQMPLSFPTYAGMIARVAHNAAEALGVDIALGPR